MHCVRRLCKQVPQSVIGSDDESSVAAGVGQMGSGEGDVREQVASVIGWEALGMCAPDWQRFGRSWSYLGWLYRV